MSQEPFVSADVAAQFLSVTRRYVLALARQGIAGSYAIGSGSVRKIWVFRLSELATSVEQQNSLIQKTRKCVTIRSGNLHAGKRNV
jgi:hypothetical protein